MRALKAVAKVVLGLALGVGLAEVVFSQRDAGAFPHLNLYVADEALGVKLQPNARMKLRVADTNPVTTVRTNAQGFRGDDWPAPTPGELLVVGDSQVFGLGVEEGETFSARLSELLGVPVLNAGVPTYGPREYTAVVEEVLRARRPATVVYVMNLSNDLFEVDRPNKDRHAVWDGWAVRTETAPEAVTDFPFRRALMSRSHLVFALRRLLHTSADAAANPGFATEGSWRDVVSASAGVQAPPPADEATREMLSRREGLAKQLEEVDERIRDVVSVRVDDDEAFARGLQPIAPKGGDPRDIVQVRYAEGARRADKTAYELFMASVGLERNAEVLAKLATKQRVGDLVTLLEQRKKLRESAGALREEQPGLAPRPIDPVLQATKAACDAAGARLVVVALPLDVMVSPDEWKKYGVPAIDMSPTRVLIDDLVARADRLGALGVDPTAALAAEEPGVFLDGDLHLTPKGHLALARFLAGELTRPREVKSELALPPGRSWPPTEDEWRQVDECKVKGSSALSCETRLVREWLRVVCRDLEVDGGPPHRVVEISVLSGGHGDTATFRYEGDTLIIPVLEGDEAKVRFVWDHELRELTLSWPRGGARAFSFGDAKRANPRQAVGGLKYVQHPYMSPLQGAACPDGQVRAGAMRRCAPGCDDQTPCATGTCTPWPGGSFCAVP